jgi:hypothetical protein
VYVRDGFVLNNLRDLAEKKVVSFELKESFNVV